MGTSIFSIGATAGTTDVVGHADLLSGWSEEVLVTYVGPGGPAI